MAVAGTAKRVAMQLNDNAGSVATGVLEEREMNDPGNQGWGDQDLAARADDGIEDGLSDGLGNAKALRWLRLIC